MKKRISVYCSYKFDKFEGCKISFYARDIEPLINIQDVKTVGSELLEEASIIHALNYFKNEYFVEIFMYPEKIYKKITKGKISKELRKAISKNSVNFYWLRAGESNSYLEELNRKMDK